MSLHVITSIVTYTVTRADVHVVVKDTAQEEEPNLHNYWYRFLITLVTSITTVAMHVLHKLFHRFHTIKLVTQMKLG